MKLESASVSAEMLNYEFDSKNLVSLVVSSAVGVWYLLKKVGGWLGEASSTIAAAFSHTHY